MIQKTFIYQNESIKILEFKDIRNPDVKERFDKYREKMRKVFGANCDILTKLHGTYEKNVKGI